MGRALPLGFGAQVTRCSGRHCGILDRRYSLELQLIIQPYHDESPGRIVKTNFMLVPTKMDDESTTPRRCFHFQVPLVPVAEQHVITKAVVRLRYVSSRSWPETFQEFDERTLPRGPDSGSLSQIDAAMQLPDQYEGRMVAQSQRLRERCCILRQRGWFWHEQISIR